MIYSGCLYHGCSCIKNRTEELDRRAYNTKEKERFLRGKGCEVIKMKGCEWRKLLPKVKYTKTRFPRNLG